LVLHTEKTNAQPKELGIAGKKNFSSTTLQDISSALINLGFKAPDVQEVVGRLPESIDFQEGLRQGLFSLGKGL
jgi:hypothetical protein